MTIPACAAPISRGPNKGQPATGTEAGYQRHYYANETPCEACYAGASATVRARKQLERKQPEPRPAARVSRGTTPPARADTDWKQQGACYGTFDRTFFPGTTGDQGKKYAEAAKAVCETCSVTAQCLEYALSLPLHLAEWGVWGGLTPKERRKLRKARRT